MKKAVLIIGAILIFITVIYNTSFSKNSIDGTYHMIQATRNGKDYAPLANRYGGVQMKINDNELIMTSKTGEVSYFTINKNTKTITTYDNHTFPYSLSGRDFVITDSGSKIVFAKD